MQSARQEIFSSWCAVWGRWQHRMVNWLKKTLVTGANCIREFYVDNVPSDIT